jgi:uroporphyrinogen III methyltransferase/synthase
VALIRWGTRAEQQTLTGTLANIEQRVREAGFEPPAVIVVGEVVRQRETLAWIERKPLFGRRILVTRSRAQASELADRIDELGGEPYEFPVIETRWPETGGAEQAIRRAFDQAESYDWVILTSVNGVDYFFRWLERCDTDIRRFHRARFAAVGPRTAEALAARGIRPDALPEQFQAEGLLEALEGRIRSGQKALLPRGDLARDALPRQLALLGVEAVEIDVYETVPADSRDPFLLEMLKEGAIHAVTFTSSSTIVHLLRALERLGAPDPATLLEAARIVCIGPVTARTAEEHGLKVAATAERSTMEGLTDALCRLWRASD